MAIMKSTVLSNFGYLRELIETFDVFVFCCKQPWVFALSLLGLTPLAERVSFLTE